MLIILYNKECLEVLLNQKKAPGGAIAKGTASQPQMYLVQDYSKLRTERKPASPVEDMPENPE